MDFEGIVGRPVKGCTASICETPAELLSYHHPSRALKKMNALKTNQCLDWFLNKRKNGHKTPHLSSLNDLKHLDPDNCALHLHTVSGLGAFSGT